MRISDWSSDVCSSDLSRCERRRYTNRNRLYGVKAMNIGEMIRKDKGSVIGFIAQPTYGSEHVFFARVESDHAREPLFALKTTTPIGRRFPLAPICAPVPKPEREPIFGGHKHSAQ